MNSRDNILVKVFPTQKIHIRPDDQ